jgi:Sec-independent protein translocase protein TatA
MQVLGIGLLEVAAIAIVSIAVLTPSQLDSLVSDVMSAFRRRRF